MKFVYALLEVQSGFFKIGVAKDIEKRIKTLHTGQSDRLELFCKLETPWASAYEKYIHDRLENEPEARRVIAGAGTEFFSVAPETVHRVFSEAEEFVSRLKETEVQVLELAKIEPVSELIAPDETFRELAGELRDVKNQIALLQWQQEYLEGQLKVAIANHEGIDGVATWKSQVTNRFQQSDFKEKHPRLFDRFTVEGRMRVLRLTN